MKMRLMKIRRNEDEYYTVLPYYHPAVGSQEDEILCTTLEEVLKTVHHLFAREEESGQPETSENES